MGQRGEGGEGWDHPRAPKHEQKGLPSPPPHPCALPSPSPRLPPPAAIASCSVGSCRSREGRRGSRLWGLRGPWGPQSCIWDLGSSGCSVRIRRFSVLRASGGDRGGIPSASRWDVGIPGIPMDAGGVSPAVTASPRALLGSPWGLRCCGVRDWALKAALRPPAVRMRPVVKR